MTVSEPQRDRPAHLFDFFVNRRSDGGVADVGIDLHQEVAADDHRLGLGMIDVAGMMARPRATSSRTNSGVTYSGMAAPKLCPSRSRLSAYRGRDSRELRHFLFSGVTMPRLAYASA